MGREKKYLLITQESDEKRNKSPEIAGINARPGTTERRLPVRSKDFVGSPDDVRRPSQGHWRN